VEERDTREETRRRGLHSFRFCRALIQRDDKKRAGPRELTSQTCSMRGEKCATCIAQRVYSPFSLCRSFPFPSLFPSVETHHCSRLSIHRTPLRIVIEIEAVEYIRHDCYRMTTGRVADNRDRRVSSSFRLGF
jgi:hypothetical protein